MLPERNFYDSSLSGSGIVPGKSSGNKKLKNLFNPKYEARELQKASGSAGKLAYAKHKL